MKIPFNFFIVIAQHRSGSTLLSTALSRQKNILFFSLSSLEKYSSFGKTNEYNDAKKRLQFRSGKKGNLIIKLAYSILSRKKTFQKIFGFRAHPSSFVEIPDYFKFLYEKNARIIFLTRNNKLLRFISLKTALKIGCVNSSHNHKESNNIFKLNPINIDYNEFIKYKINTEKIDKKILSNIKKYNLPCLHITYEELTENFNECFNKIFNFLELDPNTIINLKKQDGRIGRHKKINIYKLEDKIINYLQFKKAAEISNDVETLNFLKNEK